MKLLPTLAFMALVVGCGGAQPRASQPVTPAPTPVPPPASGGEHTAAPAPVAGLRVQGDGWSATLPGEWTESTNPQGAPQWTSVITPDRAERRVFSVNTIHGAEPFEQVVQMLPAQYRQNGAEPSAPRLFEHQGRRVAEFSVRTPPRTQQIPMYTAILIEGQRGLVITCVGESSDGLDRLCRGVINGASIGPDGSTQPRTRAPAGSQWMGAQGRFVPVPADWQRSATEQGDDTVMAMADAGEHHVVNLFFLNGIQGTPAEAIEAGHRAALEDRANSITRTEPIRAGRRTGLLMEGTRATASGTDVMLFQWVVAVAPGTFMAIACAGPSDDVRAHSELYRAALESFTVTAR